VDLGQYLMTVDQVARRRVRRVVVERTVFDDAETEDR
jgi:hypothetical protein